MDEQGQSANVARWVFATHLSPALPAEEKVDEGATIVAAMMSSDDLTKYQDTAVADQPVQRIDASSPDCLSDNSVRRFSNAYGQFCVGFREVDRCWRVSTQRFRRYRRKEEVSRSSVKVDLLYLLRWREQ